MLYVSSSSCQQYLVCSSLDILKPMQQLQRLNEVQITQDKTTESPHFSGCYWCRNFWTWNLFCSTVEAAGFLEYQLLD
jgi:hypothetical protein